MMNWSHNSLEKVVATRPDRLHQLAPTLTEGETEHLLQSYHPDYIGQERPLKLGPNSNDSFFPLELAELLEADSPLPESFQPKIELETDVLIIGGGGAGVAAALALEGSNLNVHIATKLRLGDSNTIMAEGGIQAALGSQDSTRRHFADALVGGHGKNDKDLLRLLCQKGPESIKWLTQLGCLFDQNPDGTFRLRSGGGTSIPRVLACRDYTGLEIMRVLRDAIRGGGTKILETHAALELLDDGEGQVTGAVLWNSQSRGLMSVSARAVLLATGGSGQLRFQGFSTSNHFGATGDGLVLAYRQGCSLVHPESYQYHPSGACYPEALAGQLLTEGIRSLGAHILNSKGERFVDEMTYRDVVAAAIIKECQEDRGVETPNRRVGVWLDTPLIDLKHGAGTVRSQFPGLIHRFERYGIQPDRQPLLIFPTQHYQNGGIYIDSQGKTERDGLWAAGEVCGGLHGTNRLMGNSLLDVVVFGRRAGESIRNHLPKRKPITLSALKRFRDERSKYQDLPQTISPRFFPLESQMKVEISDPNPLDKASSSGSALGTFSFDPPDPFTRKPSS